MTTNKNTHKPAKAAHDPNILRSGQNVTIMAPVAEVAAEFGPDSAPNNHNLMKGGD